MTEKALKQLAEMSNRYGSDSAYVLAGGGNTSYKNDDTLYIKPSGTALATIQPEDFVAMDRAGLDAMMNATYSSDDAEREAQALEKLMAAISNKGSARRPSVETPLHNLFPFAYVLHIHPAAVNGLTCGKDGKKLAAELFPDAVWVDITKPGYTLAALCKDALADYQAKTGKAAQILILQNHGIFYAADTVAEIDALSDRVMTALKARIPAEPDFSEAEFDVERAAAIAPAIRMAFSPEVPAVVEFVNVQAGMKFTASREAFQPLEKPFTPDHIVYCKAYPLFVEKVEDVTAQADAAAAALKEYTERNGFAPKVVAVEGLGFFVCGKNKKETGVTRALLLDSLKIATYVDGFGGALPMTQEYIDFIVNWEVESYRQKVSLAAGSGKRLTGKITVITGSAQGFGKGIAEMMAAEGAYIIVADMNGDGAKACADELNEKFGAGTAAPVTVNVSDEDSVKSMMEQTVLAYGGVDVFVNNAGIVRSGGLDVMTKSNFELVTAVNYTAYFLCVKYASAVMKIQNRIAPNYMMDIVEINSKSGLAGSNKNFAYAGSKFGGIGLTQSFAMELVTNNIKVNAVCPGNFLDGPLWSDPERGLFKQYLDAGKVPGAKTVADVKRFYEAKVPMNRGCYPIDVVRAILYIIEQAYETGQALPVTGGQEMLH